MDFRAKTILLVEDEEITSLIEKKWLMKEGFNVICSGSGQEAICLIQSGSCQIDLILMDIDLGSGSMDGISAASEIMKDHDIPILFLSSHTEKDITLRTEEVASYGYMVKGSDFTALLASVKMAFRLHQANTNLKIKEKELLEREKMMESFFGQSLDGFFFMMLDQPVVWNETADKDAMLDYIFSHQRITKINDAMLEQYRASRDQFLNLTPNDFFAHDIEYGKKVWRRFFDEGHLHIETDERKFDGSVMYVEGDYVCLYDDQGRIKGHFGIQREVTKQKQTEEALFQSEETYRLLFQNNLQAIFYSEPNGTVLKVNNVALELFGYTEEEFLSLGRNGVIDTTDPNLPAALEERKQTGKYTGVLHFRKKDGTIFPALLDSKIFTLKDGTERTINVMSDITDRVSAENKLRENNAKLLRMNAAKDKLFSIIAHDLRGPFAGFMGLTETMSMAIDTLSKEEIAEFASAMNSTSKRIYELLNNLLEWSRLQTGRYEFRKMPLDLNEEADKVRNLFASAAAEKSIAILNEVNIAASALADRNTLSIVLTNLISNAIKFTHPGGRIVISAKSGPDSAEFSVKDTGVGMDYKAIERVFRIDSGYTTTGTGGEKGSGLGLTLCKELIEAAGGSFSVSSIPGQGSTFSFSFPVNFSEEN